MYRITAICLCLTFLVVAVPRASAQPVPESEHLEPLAWQIGDWVTEYQASTDSGPIKKGDTVTVHFSLRWAPDHSYMVNNSSSHVNGKRIANGLEVISWDHEKSIISHAYHGTWGTGTGVWKPTGDTATLDWTISGEYGTFKGTSHVTKGGGSWQWQIRDQTHDGEKMPEMPETTFRRAVGEPAGELWTAYCEKAVGKWVGEGKLLWDIPQYEMAEEDPFSLTLSLQPEPDGKVLTGPQTFQVGNQSKQFGAHIVVGWDPDSSQIRLYAFWHDGFIEQIFLSRMNGKQFIGTYTSKAPASPTDRWPISLKFNGPNSYEYRFTGGPHKGKVLSAWKRAKD